MSNNSDIELSNSDDCEKYVNQFIQEFPLRRAEIGQGTVIKRALPSRHKRMIGALVFSGSCGSGHFPARRWSGYRTTSAHWSADLYLDDRRQHDAQ